MHIITRETHLSWNHCCYVIVVLYTYHNLQFLSTSVCLSIMLWNRLMRRCVCIFSSVLYTVYFYPSCTRCGIQTRNKYWQDSIINFMAWKNYYHCTVSGEKMVAARCAVINFFVFSVFLRLIYHPRFQSVVVSQAIKNLSLIHIWRCRRRG